MFKKLVPWKYLAASRLHVLRTALVKKEEANFIVYSKAIIVSSAIQSFDLRCIYVIFTRTWRNMKLNSELQGQIL